MYNRRKLIDNITKSANIINNKNSHGLANYFIGSVKVSNFMIQQLFEEDIRTVEQNIINKLN